MVSRQIRCEVLIESDASFAQSIADHIRKDFDVHIISQPKQVLAMNKVRESAKNSLFYLGEVLVTQAMVEIEGTRGLGLVIGDNDELALNLAVVDAAFSSPALASKYEWLEVKILNAYQALQEQREAELSRVFSTKVDFETMVEEL
ncbi:MAG: phosphonate C-P lyase system protein PhnG [Coriobacteriia bacterium]|nr:phosphonate C-P lyase system protein PhnG [Coriobacteriia bacterium]